MFVRYRQKLAGMLTAYWRMKLIQRRKTKQRRLQQKREVAHSEINAILNRRLQNALGKNRLLISRALKAGQDSYEIGFAKGGDTICCKDPELVKALIKMGFNAVLVE